MIEPGRLILTMMPSLHCKLDCPHCYLTKQQRHSKDCLTLEQIKTTVEKIEVASLDQNMSFFDSILYVAENRLVHAGAAKKLRHFHNMIEQMRTGAVDMTPSEIYMGVLDSTEYAIRLKEENSPESLARIDNLEELDNAIRHFEEERGEDGKVIWKPRRPPQPLLSRQETERQFGSEAYVSAAELEELARRLYSASPSS